MAELLSVRCGFCGNRFALLPEQRGQAIRCPHCKIVTRVGAVSETATDAARAMADALPTKREVSAQRRVVLPRGGVRNRVVAILWAVLVLVGLMVGIVVLVKIQMQAQEPAAAPEAGYVVPGPRSRLPPPLRPDAVPGADAAAPGAESPAPTVTAAAVNVQVTRLLGGFRDGTLTYAVGRLTNGSDAPLKAIRIFLHVMDAQENALGDAAVTLYNVPPRTTVPVVAEWTHEVGVRGTRWRMHYEVEPADAAAGLPPLVATDPVPIAERDVLVHTGQVRMQVTNRGAAEVPRADLSAILVDKDGKIVGAIKAVVDHPFAPGKPEEVTLSWDHCPAHFVVSAEVWAQPAAGPN